MKKKQNRPLLRKSQRKKMQGGISGIRFDDLTQEQKRAFVDHQVVQVIQSCKNMHNFNDGIV